MSRAPVLHELRVGFDGSALTIDGKGAARVQGELLRALAELDPDAPLVVFVPEDADERLLPRPPRWRYVTARMQPALRWEQLGLPLAARRERLDVVLTTSERSALVGVAQVAFIFEHPRHRIERQRRERVPVRQRLVNAVTGLLFRLSTRRAAVVVAASESTARDLAPLRRTPVVHLGVGRKFAPDPARAAAARARVSAPGGYLLHLASDDPRENNETLFAALASLAGWGLRPVVAIAGAARARLPSLRALAERLGVDDQIRWLGFQSDDELIDLYRGALAYVDPSLYEGLPLQPLEAMACGTPTITSNTTSFPELVGDAGILVDPRDAEGFAKAIRRLLEEPAVLEQLRAKALARAAAFSWERTAVELLAHCAAATRG